MKDFVTILLFVCLFVLISGIIGKPLKSSQEAAPEANPVEYLLNYGYIPQVSFRGVSGFADNANLLDEKSPAVKKAIEDFQDFAGLPRTGRIDKETLDLMKSPRCGVKDKGAVDSELRRFKRYVKHSSSWEKTRLTYFIGSYPSDSLMSKDEIDEQIADAFNAWAKASPLTFRRVFSDTADMRLDFFHGRHGQDAPFDGRGGVLAHAFFPRWGGDVHFDAAEDWVSRYSPSRVRRGAKQFLQTAMHEIGHSLGLQHSKDRSSIMAPFYQGWMDSVELRSDDINGIRDIYGDVALTPDGDDSDGVILVKPQDKPMAIPRPPPVFRPVIPVNKASICADPRFDAATETADGSFYVFRGDRHWKLKKNTAGVENGYPRPNTDWSGLPGSVDATFFNPADGMTYIIKGGQVGKYRNKRIQSGYPKSLSAEFSGAPDDTEDRPLDAALVWGKNNQLYLFRGSQYWKYNFDKRTVEDFYPRDVAKNWRGLPGNGIHAALRWKNGKSYFFRDGEYWRFDDEKVAVENKSRVKYPRTIGKWWLGCHVRPQTEPDPAGTNREPRKRWIWSD